MRNIEFYAGYYEWRLFIDDELVYVFGDSDNENYNTKKQLHSYIDIVMEAIDDEANSEDSESWGYGFCGLYGEDKKQENKELWLSLTKKERLLVKRAIFRGWKRYCVSDYQVKKEEVRQQAIDYQLETSERCLSYGELFEMTSYFERLGKRYGLLKEFRENGIC